LPVILEYVNILISPAINCRFTMLKVTLLIMILLGINACGSSYTYKHVDPDGSSCELSILSVRDIQAGELKITPKCGLLGGADSMTSNEKALDAINSLVNKIP